MKYACCLMAVDPIFKFPISSRWLWSLQGILQTLLCTVYARVAYIYSVCNGFLLLMRVRTSLCCLFVRQETLQKRYGLVLYRSDDSEQHCHGPNLLWAEMSIFPTA